MAKIILVSFGGPRSLDEVGSFLREILTDQEMVRTSLPLWLHRFFFSMIAWVRTPALKKRYKLIGGKSPVFEDTERLSEAFKHVVLPFYRYLPRTHSSFLERLISFADGEKITVLPLFPQYSITTTGSAKVWFKEHVPEKINRQLHWIDSYATHPTFIQVWVERIRSFLKEEGVLEEEAILLFSAHGLPQKIVDQGDPYERECIVSFEVVSKVFTKARSLLSFQSKLGVGRWLQPATKDVCKTIEGRRHVVFIPITFTTDHIETLYEIECDYMPVIRKRGMIPHRCPTPDLSHALAEISY